MPLRHVTRRILISGVTAAVVALSATSSAAAPKSLAWISVDAKTGAILAQHDARQPRHPASLTKMMTIYMALDAIERGRWTMDTPLKVSANAAAKPASKLYVKAGSTISVRDAIHAMAIKSANDVATVVAENFSGSEEAFGETMTQAAHQLGMRDTTFVNASGLHDERQVTTAYDMYRLGLALQDRFPEEYKIFGKSGFNYRGHWIGGHNPFLGMWQGVDGIKTGYTNASGFNLVTNLEKSGRHIIAVVVGASTSSQRNDKMASLMTRTFPQATSGVRTMAELDRKVWVEPIRVGWTTDMRPQARQLEPRGNDITPPEKPMLFAQLPENFFAKDPAVLQRMINDIASLQGNEVPATDDIPQRPSSATSLASARLQKTPTLSTKGHSENWDLFSSGVNEAPAGRSLTVHAGRNRVADCLQQQDCYMAGAEIDGSGNLRVNSPSIYSAMMTSSSE